MKIKYQTNSITKMVPFNDLLIGDVFCFLPADLATKVCIKVSENSFISLSGDRIKLTQQDGEDDIYPVTISEIIFTDAV